MWRRRAKLWILPMPMKTNDSTEKWTWWPDTKPRHCSACQSTSKTASSASSNSSTKRVAYSPARTNRLVLPSACTYLTIATTITAKWAIFGTVAHILILKYVLASVYEGLSVGWLVGRSDGRSVACFFKMPILNSFLHERHREGQTTTLLNELSVLNVPHVHQELNNLGVIKSGTRCS